MNRDEISKREAAHIQGWVAQGRQARVAEVAAEQKAQATETPEQRQNRQNAATEKVASRQQQAERQGQGL